MQNLFKIVLVFVFLFIPSVSFGFYNVNSLDTYGTIKSAGNGHYAVSVTQWCNDGADITVAGRTKDNVLTILYTNFVGYFYGLLDVSSMFDDSDNFDEVEIVIDCTSYNVTTSEYTDFPLRITEVYKVDHSGNIVYGLAILIFIVGLFFWDFMWRYLMPK